MSRLRTSIVVLAAGLPTALVGVRGQGQGAEAPRLSAGEVVVELSRYDRPAGQGATGVRL